MLERIRNFLQDTNNRMGIFAGAVAIMVVLRAIGFSGLALFLGMIYVMYFVSMARNR